ncbi:MAG: hypothetical protein QM762_25675 [Chryseolinea sp.]
MENEYYSDMAGSVDSIAFYNREYSSTTDFTYRKVHSNRTRLTLEHQWNEQQETVLTLAYRDNYIEQNPNYSICWTTGSTSATGERNRNSFYSQVALLQHRIKFNFLDAKLLTGGSIDYSPTDYWAYRIDLCSSAEARWKICRALHDRRRNIQTYTYQTTRQTSGTTQLTRSSRSIPLNG